MLTDQVIRLVPHETIHFDGNLCNLKIMFVNQHLNARSAVQGFMHVIDNHLPYLEHYQIDRLSAKIKSLLQSDYPKALAELQLHNGNGLRGVGLNLFLTVEGNANHAEVEIERVYYFTRSPVEPGLTFEPEKWSDVEIFEPTSDSIAVHRQVA